MPRTILRMTITTSMSPMMAMMPTPTVNKAHRPCGNSRFFGLYCFFARGFLTGRSAQREVPSGAMAFHFASTSGLQAMH